MLYSTQWILVHFGTRILKFSGGETYFFAFRKSQLKNIMFSQVKSMTFRTFCQKVMHLDCVFALLFNGVVHMAKTVEKHKEKS